MAPVFRPTPMLAALWSVVVLTLGAALPGPVSGAAGDAGQRVLRNQGCVQCHTVGGAGIKTVSRAARATEGPDLSGLGARYRTATLQRYLRQESAAPGRHAHRFKGSDEELQALVDWLLEQKR